MEMGKKTEHRVVVQCDRVSSEESKVTVGSGCETTSSFGSGSVGGPGPGLGPEVSHLGWGRWYTLRELEDATGGLSPENVVGVLVHVKGGVWYWMCNRQVLWLI